MAQDNTDVADDDEVNLVGSFVESFLSFILFSALLIISFVLSNKFIHNYPIVIKTTLSQANIFYYNLINVCLLFVFPI